MGYKESDFTWMETTWGHQSKTQQFLLFGSVPTGPFEQQTNITNTNVVLDDATSTFPNVLDHGAQVLRQDVLGYLRPERCDEHDRNNDRTTYQG